MNVLHVFPTRKSLPPVKYGGMERVIWALACAQESAGDAVRFLWGRAPSLPPNASVMDTAEPLCRQVDDWPDIVHLHYRDPELEELQHPFLVTEHMNHDRVFDYPLNTVFVSRNHAHNHAAECFVYNGLDWGGYGEPRLDRSDDYCHFIGKARLPVKNLDGAIRVARRAGVRLAVMGGRRLDVHLRYGVRFRTGLDIRFFGDVDGERKNRLIRNSRGLISPVRWHEPFGLVFIESLYLGCPVFSTPYGAIPEIVDAPELGCLSTDAGELADAVAGADEFDRRLCHESVRERFGAARMCEDYRRCYERVLDGESLNPAPPRSDGRRRELLPFGAGCRTSGGAVRDNLPGA